MGLMAARKKARQERGERGRYSAGRRMNMRGIFFTIRIIIWIWRMEGLWIDRCEACSS